MSQSSNKYNEIGFVRRAKHYLLSIEGLPSARLNDIIVNEEGKRAIVRALNDDHITALMLDQATLKVGDRFMFSEEDGLFPCGEHLFGRIITALGDPADGGPDFPKGGVPFEMEVDAPGIEYREPIHQQIETGLTLVDTLLPIAKGQRQLLFGPMNSGMTQFLIETIVNQQKQGVICIYVAIGKPINDLREISDVILGEGRGSKTIIISALSDEPSPIISLAPSSAYLIADHFRALGEDVLVVLDELGAHAKYLREIALLEGRLPSTESYPGDIFYQHAHLMERSGHFGPELGGGSVTTLPIIETDFKNFSDLIPTNLMACTDGHLAFRSELYAQGTYPSISIEESVTRVGRHAQNVLQKQLTGHIQILLGRYSEQKEYSQFSAQLTREARTVLRQGQMLEEFLRQDPLTGIPMWVQVPLVALVFTSFLEERDLDFVINNKGKLIQEISTNPELKPLHGDVAGDLSIDEYLPRLEAARDIFEAVCQQ